MASVFLAHVGHDHAAHHWFPPILLLALAAVAGVIFLLRRACAKEARRV